MYWKVDIDFKNGAHIEHEADSYWTEYNPKHNYLKFFEGDADAKDENYLCFHDYCMMNPVSHDTKKADYTNLRDEIQVSGNEAQYFEKDHTMCDSWCTSVRYDQIDSCKVYNSEFWVNIYKDGVKYN